MRLLPGAGSPISVRTLLPEAAIQGAEDIVVDACVADVAEIRPGSVFVAVEKGTRGQTPLIAEAVRRGCAAILTDEPVAPVGVPVCRVSDARLAFARLCHALAGDPGRKLKVVAISGERGKRSTACLVAGVLHAAGYRLGILGSLGCLDGRNVTRLASFPPRPDRTATLLGRMVANGCSHAIVEVPADGVRDGRLAGIPFDMLALTWADDLTEAQHPGAAALANSIAGWDPLLEHLAHDGLALVNAEDPFLAARLSEIDGPVLTVGFRAAAEIRGVRVDQDAGGQTFLLVAGSDIMPVAVRTPGRDHLIHCLLAAAVGLAYQIDLPTVVRGLESVDYVPGRLERIDSGWPVAVFVDGMRSHWALAASLQALREAVAGRIFCIVGVAPRPDEGAFRAMIEAACRVADTVIVTRTPPKGGAPRRRRPSSAANWHTSSQADTTRGTTAKSWSRKVAGWLAETGAAFGLQRVPDRFEAFSAAVAQARPGDAVLVLADDAREVRAWLSRVWPPEPSCCNDVYAARGPV